MNRASPNGRRARRERSSPGLHDLARGVAHAYARWSERPGLIMTRDCSTSAAADREGAATRVYAATQRDGWPGARATNHQGRTTPSHPDPNESEEREVIGPGEAPGASSGHRSIEVTMSTAYVYETERLRRGDRRGSAPGRRAITAAARPSAATDIDVEDRHGESTATETVDGGGRD